MKLFWEILLLALASTLLIPCITLFLECSFALLPRSYSLFSQKQVLIEPTILIPAHNEEIVIGLTLESLLPQVENTKNIIVIADNCTDNTAEIARNYGVTVIERENEQKRGKGYALDYGLQFLQNDPPEIMIFFDADCVVEPGAVKLLVQEVMETGKPIQALYLLEQPANPTGKHFISVFSFLVKNLVRPAGLNKLGLPCLLTGTGMAFPWSILQKVSLASGNIVEDMQLGLDLAVEGYPPRLCSKARVTGVLPQQEQAAKTQSKRWEHGHLNTILKQSPSLFWEAIIQRRWDLFALGLEVSIPPLSLLILLWAVSFIGTFISWSIGFSSSVPVILLTVSGLLLITSIISAWAKFGRDQIPATALVTIPIYFLGKISLYLSFLLKPQNIWVRTERD